MKMSDVFALPLTNVEDSYPVDSNGYETMTTSKEDKASIHAINCHDELVEALGESLRVISMYVGRDNPIYIDALKTYEKAKS